ncbi:hypothetical protein Scep_012871 [Stephania cephalantha]|uniref:Helicase C-terminal domain-containing protein n=1 Tax=Stephania cephalantha TaxID=152367 RepID=A0AAP0P737_9MAGN
MSLLKYEILKAFRLDALRKTRQQILLFRLGLFLKFSTSGPNYADIFGYLRQLRQAVDHPYLVNFSYASVLHNKSSDNDEPECGICSQPAAEPVKKSLMIKVKLHALPVGSSLSLRNRSKKPNVKGFKSSSILKKIRLEDFQTSTKIEALALLHTKLPANMMREEIRIMVEQDRSAKGIVFSHFTSFLDLIQYALQESGIQSVQWFDSVAFAVQDAAIKKFTNDPACRIFLVGLKSRSVGLNLTVASHVFMMDPWWDPAIEQHAQDRIHWIGEYKPIRIVKFIMENTVEENDDASAAKGIGLRRATWKLSVGGDDPGCKGGGVGAPTEVDYLGGAKTSKGDEVIVSDDDNGDDDDVVYNYSDSGGSDYLCLSDSSVHESDGCCDSGEDSKKKKKKKKKARKEEEEEVLVEERELEGEDRERDAVVENVVPNVVPENRNRRRRGRRGRKEENMPALLWEIWEEENERWVDENEDKEVDLDDQDEIEEVAEAPSDLLLPLLRYQREWLAWALKQEDSHCRGGILADEMGMGKTIQAVALVIAKRAISSTGFESGVHSSTPSSSMGLPELKCTLVICPLVAVTQWKNEIAMYTREGSTKVLIYHGANRRKKLSQFSDYDFVLTTYSTVEAEYRKHVMPPKEKCNWCGKHYYHDKMVTHLRYFCGPDAIKTERQSKQVRKKGKRELKSFDSKSTEEVDKIKLKKGKINVEMDAKMKKKQQKKRKKSDINSSKENSPNPEQSSLINNSVLHSVKWARIILDEVNLQLLLHCSNNLNYVFSAVHHVLIWFFFWHLR